jgi:hypothetical protein
MMNEG